MKKKLLQNVKSQRKNEQQTNKFKDSFLTTKDLNPYSYLFSTNLSSNSQIKNQKQKSPNQAGPFRPENGQIDKKKRSGKRHNKKNKKRSDEPKEEQKLEPANQNFSVTTTTDLGSNKPVMSGLETLKLNQLLQVVPLLENSIDKQQNEYDECLLGRRAQQTQQTDDSDGQEDDEQTSKLIKPFQWVYFNMILQFHQFRIEGFKETGHPNYRKRYQHSRVQYLIQHDVKYKVMTGFRTVSINCDMNIISTYNEGTGSYRKVYLGVDDNSRAKQIVRFIETLMKQGVDFILLQQVTKKVIRNELLKALKRLANTRENKYFYPANLQLEAQKFTTLILSRYPVKFGEIQFRIPREEIPKKDHFLPVQAFCEFKVVVDGKIERIAIMSCHLKSNRAKYIFQNREIRKVQFDCIEHFSRNYDRFFCIGDTNVPSSSRRCEKDLKEFFYDSYKRGYSQIGGSYLFRKNSKNVTSERLDRVLIKKDMKYNTAVSISYFDDVLLEGCEDVEDSPEELLKNNDDLTYKTINDHKILDIMILLGN